MNKFWKRKKNFIKGLALFVAAAVTAVALSPSEPVKAEFKAEDAITYQQFAASHQIENGTLFIGVFIIPLNQLNDSNFQIASDMMGEANQFQKYYKSELSGGAWYDVSSAQGISAITSSGQLVEQEEMDPLYVRYYIGSDGVTYDAKTGAPIFLFDINSAYDVTKIKELQTLYQLYKGNFDEEKSKGVDRYYYLKLQSFFANTGALLHDSQTDLYDQALQGLYAAYLTANNAGKKEEAAVIMELQDKVDALRRAIIYRKLAISEDDNNLSYLEKLNKINDRETYDEYCQENKIFSLQEVNDYFNRKDDEDDDDESDDIPLNKLYEMIPGTPYEGGTIDKEDFRVNSEIQDAIQTAIGDCGVAYNTYDAKALVDSDKVLAHAEYYKSMQIVYSAASGGALDGFIDELQTIRNISSNTIKDAKKELAAIDGSLLGEADGKYKGELSKGVGTKYQAVANQGGDDIAKKNAIEEQTTDLEAARAELEFLISAKKSRQSTTEALNFINNRINIADGYMGTIVNDAFKDSATVSLKSHIIFLKDVQNRIKNSDDSLKSELDKLKDQKEALLLKKQEALDDNDLNGAKKAEKLIETLDKAIAEETERLNAIANGEGATAADKAGAENDLDGTTEGAIASLRDKAIDALNSGNDADAAIQGLKDLGAVEALQDIVDATGNKDAAKALDEAKEVAKAEGLDGDGSGSDGSGGAGGDGAGGDGAGGDDAGGDDAGADDGSDDDSSDDDASDDDGSDDDAGADDDGKDAADKAAERAAAKETAAAGKISSDDLNAALRDILGGEFGDLDADGKIIAATVANRIGLKGNTEMSELAQLWITNCANEKNKYVYNTLNNGDGTEYASAEVIGRVTDYRYVYDASKNEATLSEKGKAYNFHGGSDEMVSGGATKNQMDEKAVYKNKTVYLSEGTAQDIFSLDVENIDSSKYSAVLTDEMNRKAEELYKTLLGLK